MWMSSYTEGKGLLSTPWAEFEGIQRSKQPRGVRTALGWSIEAIEVPLTRDNRLVHERAAEKCWDMSVQGLLSHCVGQAITEEHCCHIEQTSVWWQRLNNTIKMLADMFQNTLISYITSAKEWIAFPSFIKRTGTDWQSTSYCRMRDTSRERSTGDTKFNTFCINPDSRK